MENENQENLNQENNTKTQTKAIVEETRSYSQGEIDEMIKKRIDRANSKNLKEQEAFNKEKFTFNLEKRGMNIPEKEIDKLYNLTNGNLDELTKIAEIFSNLEIKQKEENIYNHQNNQPKKIDKKEKDPISLKEEMDSAVKKAQER